jgi:hypothetical protein
LDAAGLIADVDGYHAGVAVRSGQALAAHLRGGDRTTRLARFFTARFDNDLDTATTLAQDMLTVTGDTALVAARTLLLMGMAANPVVAGTELSGFCAAFAARLSALAGGERPNPHPSTRPHPRKAE